MKQVVMKWAILHIVARRYFLSFSIHGGHDWSAFIKY
jgi:hypothetical protein